MHFSSSSYFLLTAALCSLGQAAYCTDPGNEPQGVPACQSVVVYAARGTDGSYHNGSVVNPAYDQLPSQLEDIARAVISKAGGKGVCRAMRYPAASCSGSDCSPYFNAIGFGTDEGQRFIRNYRAKCGTGARIVLVGYSQGAETMISVLVGEDVDQNMYSANFYGATNAPVKKSALATNLRSTIVGGTLISSPSFLPSYAIDAGDSTTRGIAYKKTPLYQDFNTNFNNRVRNYCNANDGLCASNQTDQFFGSPNHGNAPATFRDQAIAYLQSLGLA